MPQFLNGDESGAAYSPWLALNAESRRPASTAEYAGLEVLSWR